MINFPIQAEVYCSDGIAGRSTYVIGNPLKDEITHLVIQSNRPPFHESLVPVDQVEETTDNQVRLKCTRDDLSKMEPFEREEYIQTQLPGYLRWPDVPAIPGCTTEMVTTFIPVKYRNIPQGEFALRRDAKVRATDGYVGQVDELLIDSNNMHVTHLVLLERHIFQKREITIPVSQIDHVSEETIYLKLDRQRVEELSTAPIQNLP